LAAAIEGLPPGSLLVPNPEVVIYVSCPHEALALQKPGRVAGVSQYRPSPARSASRLSPPHGKAVGLYRNLLCTKRRKRPFRWGFRCNRSLVPDDKDENDPAPEQDTEDDGVHQPKSDADRQADISAITKPWDVVIVDEAHAAIRRALLIAPRGLIRQWME
jgi:hypothetical protein